MKQLEEGHIVASEGKIIVRIADSVRMGIDMYLSQKDSVENYKEVKMTAEEKAHYDALAAEAEEKKY